MGVPAVNRNRFPRWINALIDAIADRPMNLIGRIAARRMGTPEPAGSVDVTHFADTSIKVLITPTNYSGQATAWARALEANAHEIEVCSLSARSAAIDVPGGFSFSADLIVPVATYHNDSDWQRRQFSAASSATHVLIEAEEPPFGRLFNRSVEAQSVALQKAGVDVAYLAHGTDVRLPSRHRELNPWSHYNDPAIYVPRIETLAARNIALLERSGRPLFVSTPDLLLDLPSARWCPVVVDLARWQSQRSTRETSKPLRVAHAPSVGAVKGTELMLPALTQLEQEGIIELEIVQGVPSAEMPAVFARADIVIDQIRIGSYGVAACEAMASGAVVVGHVATAVRESVRAATGATLPIVEANPITLDSVLRNLAENRELAKLSKQGREFVHAVHDGGLAAETLRTYWIDRPSAKITENEDTTDAPGR